MNPRNMSIYRSIWKITRSDSIIRSTSVITRWFTITQPNHLFNAFLTEEWPLVSLTDKPVAVKLILWAETSRWENSKILIVEYTLLLLKTYSHRWSNRNIKLKIWSYMQASSKFIPEKYSTC